MAKRIGIFGGSFNPIHVGHLVIAEAAWQEFHLDHVVFIPTGDTPGKSMHDISKEDRYRMTELAIEGNPRFRISPIEVNREGISYTVNTIRTLREELGDSCEMYFIAGTDAVADLPTWKYNRELLESCHFICARRPGSEEKIKNTIAYFGSLGEAKIHCLLTPELAISSTILRDWAAKGKSLRYLMPDAVISYIRERGIYNITGKTAKNVKERGIVMTLDDIKKDLKKRLSEKRYVHSKGVSQLAEKLAKAYGADPDKARLAGLVHDCAKELSLPDMQALVKGKGLALDDYMMGSRALLHGPAGSVLAEKAYGITDKDILSGVYYHTTGCPDMTLMEKIIFLADYIEPSRDFPGVDHLRKTAFKDLDAALIEAYDDTLRHLLDQHQYVYTLTLAGRNDLILHMTADTLAALS